MIVSIVTVQCISHVQLFCDPVDCCLPGSSVHGISLVRIVECVAISFSRGLSDPEIKCVSPALVHGFFTTEPPTHSLGPWFFFQSQTKKNLETKE